MNIYNFDNMGNGHRHDLYLMFNGQKVSLIYTEKYAEEINVMEEIVLSYNPDYIKWLAANVFQLKSLFVNNKWIDACNIGYYNSDKYFFELNREIDLLDKKYSIKANMEICDDRIETFNISSELKNVTINEPITKVYKDGDLPF